MNLKRNNIANSSQPYTLPSRSKADTQTKTCQRVWLPQHTVRLRIIKHENTTRGIKHWGLSGYSSILPRIRFGVTGQESSPQSPTISYRQTLATNRKKMKRIILEDTFTFIQKFMIIFIPSFTRQRGFAIRAHKSCRHQTYLAELFLNLFLNLHNFKYL